MHQVRAAVAGGRLVAYFSGLLVAVDSVERAWEEREGVRVDALEKGDTRCVGG